MANRDNHYEAAFEAYLRSRGVPYVAVDEARRTLLGGTSIKSLDFIVSPVGAQSLLVDVKGRRFPSGVLEELVHARRPDQPGAVGAAFWLAVWRPAGFCLQYRRRPRAAGPRGTVRVPRRDLCVCRRAAGRLRPLGTSHFAALGHAGDADRRVSRGGSAVCFVPRAGDESMSRFARCRLASARRAGLTLLLVASAWLAAGDLAWAKERKVPKAPETPQKSYVLPYAVVALGVALGMILVLRPVKRDDEPKRTDLLE
jgi:hypothetical protein